MEAISCHQLSQRFGSRWILARLDFCLSAGSRLLLTGDNGAGKTTLLRILATALRPSRGTLNLFGRPVWPAGLMVRRRLALVTHQHYLYEGLCAADNLRHVATLAGSRVVLSPTTALARVGLAHTHRAPVATFSAGMKRRLALARLLMLQPALIFLDEPFAQLDPGGQDMVQDLIAELAAGGATLVVSSHDVARARRLCTHSLHLLPQGVSPQVLPLAASAALAVP